MSYIIKGKWNEGKALAPSTISSTCKRDSQGNILCYPNGEPKYDTVRCRIGEAMYQLKNKSNKMQGDILVDRAVEYLKDDWSICEKIDLIVAVPSSKKRTLQPVEYIVNGISKKLDIPCEVNILTKISSLEVKDLEPVEKEEALKGTIIKNRELNDKTNVLLVDDLYSTGATLNVCVEKLKEDDNIDKVYVLCMTKNRTR